MSTLANLQAKVASDFHRSDLTTQISDSLESAVRHYCRTRWWFLEGRAETTSSSSQSFYVVPPDFKRADSLLVEVSGSRRPLTHLSYEEMDEMDDGRSFGEPTYYSLYENSIRFFPVPNTTGNIFRISYHKNLDLPSASASNSWTSDAYDLIRYRAEWDIARHYLHDPEQAVVYKESEMETFQSMLNENLGRISTGKIRRSDW